MIPSTFVSPGWASDTIPPALPTMAMTSSGVGP